MIQKLFKKGSIISMAAISIIGMLPTSVQGEGIVFNDVSKDFWGYSSIAWATEQKIIDGYPDGTFKPEQSVTQTEFIAMLVRAYIDIQQLPDGGSSFWGASYIKHAFNLGWGSSIVVFPSSKSNSDSNGAEYNVLETRSYVAKLITNANGRNYDTDDSIRFLLDSELAEGKTDKSIEGFEGNDVLTRAEAVTFIKNLKAKLDMLYPSPRKSDPYDPTTLKMSPFEINTLYVDKPQDSTLLRYSNVSFKSPIKGYSLVHDQAYTVEGTVTDAVGNDLFIDIEYWDSGVFKPVETIKVPMINGKFSSTIDLNKFGVYRMTVSSELEHNGKKYDNNITLTSFYVDYKAK